MINLNATLLGAFDEIFQYPALLSRLGSLASDAETNPIDVSNILLDLLDPEMDVSGYDALFTQLLEEGEISAAKFLFDQGMISREQSSRITRELVIRKQNLESKARDVMGLSLLLKETQDERISELERRAYALIENPYLCNNRPGYVLKKLEPIQLNLEAIRDEAQRKIQEEMANLVKTSPSISSEDFQLALSSLKLLLKSSETLPQAQRMVLLAKRAKEGHLTEEDLKAIYKVRRAKGRLVKPREDYSPFEIKTADDVVKLLEQESSQQVRFPAEFDRKKALELFKILRPVGGKINTAPVAERLKDYLDIKSFTPDRRTGQASSFIIEFDYPRVPAFRRGKSRFPGGIHVIIPYLMEDSVIPKFLQELPDNTFPIVYYPGALDKSLIEKYRVQKEVPHFDILDLLRIGECQHDKRQLAFQQVLLPRCPLSTVKPYQAGGPVAIEMFRGRRDIIDKLRSPRGGTVLFSGRMMGKSSILDKIYNDIESAHSLDPSRKERCIKISHAGINLLDSLMSEVIRIMSRWDAEAEIKKDRQHIPTPSTSPNLRREMASGRLTHLREILSKLLRQGYRITILIDEADSFAEDDGRKPKEESLAWLLRDMEFEHPDSLRVVFAGFQTIHHQVILKNGAFANWYGLQQLGPMEREEAISLVREPFEDFGFKFASEAGIERILEFTGRHPLLIQETCSRLMERIYRRRSGRFMDEEIVVQAGDVESICRDDQLRERVYQVLSLNLNQYPRLKLMVHLILYSCSRGKGDQIQLERFSLEKLKEYLYEWFEDQFNEYFDEKSVGALVQELESLGLLGKSGDRYEFLNRTYAAMLMGDSQFENAPQEFFREATNPNSEAVRRFYTLPNEKLTLLRGLHGDTSHFIVVGLSKTMRSFIAESLAKTDEYTEKRPLLISSSKCATLEDLHHTLKASLKEKRKTLSIADFMVKNNVDTLILNDADLLARDNQLIELSNMLSDRNVRLIIFGGIALIKNYLDSLFIDKFEAITLKRLRPKDIKEWGERLIEIKEPQIVFDDETSRRLRIATGGYLPLILLFKEYCRKSMAYGKEYLPDKGTVDMFSKSLSLKLITDHLIGTIDEDCLNLLKSLYAFGSKEKLWRIPLDFAQEVIFPGIADDREEYLKLLYNIDILIMLDLVEETMEKGTRCLELDKDGPLARFL